MDQYLAVMINRASNNELDWAIIEDDRTEKMKENDEPCANGVGRSLMFKAVDHFRAFNPHLKGWFVDMVKL